MADKPNDAELWSAWLAEDVAGKTPAELQIRFDALVGLADQAEDQMARILDRLAWTNPEQWSVILERHREKHRRFQQWAKKADTNPPEPDGAM